MWWLVVEDSKLFMIVNGRRARSRNSDHTFGPVLAAEADSQNQDHVQFTFQERKTTSGKLTQIDRLATSKSLGCFLRDLDDADAVAKATNTCLTSLATNSVQSNITDTQDSSPLLDITNSPLRQKRKRSQSDVQKKHPSKKKGPAYIDEDDASIDASIAKKCKGIFVVSLGCLTEPRPDLQRKRTHQEVLQAKAQILEGKTDIRELHVIPVLCRGTFIEGDGMTQLEVLGGSLCSYVLSAKELVEDERFGHLKNGWRVKVFEDLTRMTALRVGNLYANYQVISTSASFEEQVAMCRAILYEDNGLGQEDGEPPTMKGMTRRNCALALGKSTEHNAIRALEPTFQMASYSRRCYRKAQELFSSFREKNRKHLSQFWFMKLQGLEEESRYKLLVAATSDLNLKKMAADAENIKRRCHLQDFFMKEVQAKSWDEACRRFPNHTSDKSLEPYFGLKFKKGSIPTSFMSFVRSAKSNEPDENRAALAVNDISEGNDVRTQVVTSPEARTSVYLFQDIADASSLHGEGEKRSLLHIFSETIENIRGNRVEAAISYAMICGPLALPETAVFMHQEEVFRFLIEKFSSEQEVVIDNTKTNGAVAREACELGRRGKLHEEAKEDEAIRARDILDQSFLDSVERRTSTEEDRDTSIDAIPDSEDGSGDFYLFRG